jgi:hypothetical protein
MDEAKNTIAGISDKIEGATMLMLKNTDGANALKYKVLTYANKDGVAYEEVAETEITSGNSAQVILEYAYALVVVQAKSSVGSASADYELDYIGNRN